VRVGLAGDATPRPRTLATPRRAGRLRHLEPALAQSPRRQLRPRLQPEPIEEPAEMSLDRLRGDAELRADLVVAAAVDNQPDDIELTTSQRAGADRSGLQPKASPPEAALRIASTSSAIGAVLTTKPEAPSRSAAVAYCG